jgi:hypothetical protein
VEGKRGDGRKEMGGKEREREGGQRRGRGGEGREGKGREGKGREGREGGEREKSTPPHQQILDPPLVTRMQDFAFLISKIFRGLHANSHGGRRV